MPKQKFQDERTKPRERGHLTAHFGVPLLCHCLASDRSVMPNGTKPSRHWRVIAQELAE